jgi:hypothetical protein
MECRFVYDLAYKTVTAVTFAGMVLALSEPGSQGGCWTAEGPIPWMTLYTCSMKSVSNKIARESAGAMSLRLFDAICTDPGAETHR